jgi:hypothetical protein
LPRSVILTRLAATLDDDTATTTTTTTITPVLLEEGNPLVKAAVLAAWEKQDDEHYEQEQIIMDVPQGFYALSRALKSSGIVMGLKGSPFVLRSQELISSSTGTTTTTDNDSSNKDSFGHFFTMKDLAKALEDDFLDAAKGSTDNRKGWKVRTMATTNIY